MPWWHRIRETLHWLDAAEWPDGVSWPDGRPTELPSFARARVGTAVSAPAVVLFVVALGLPLAVTILAGLLAVSPVAGYIVWRVVHEAKRQGWGSNLP